MWKPLFLRIVEGVEAHDDYFKLKRDCCGQLCFSAKQKCKTPLRILALGTAADAVGEMVRMGESTYLRTTVKFARAMVQVFGAEYLRESNAQYTERLLAIGEARGFPGMLGSIDCMHWQWKNYPKVCGNVSRRLCNGESPPCNYTDNGCEYNMRYYLADGIYPQWAAFVKTISEPQGNKQSHFATVQEAARKNVERAFGVLQAR
ncbi:uncharacterized protein [Aegilops tauschii subsp. strangulata]|uniref:uncharacterized protein n=1 Tax=Aegilops tauschii subsp. strangulata TaxID=200361 RepID=UPI00098BCB61|nr:uncharacterized protein LOC109754887 [Aegilops tauschii subsp. strangulata]